MPLIQSKEIGLNDLGSCFTLRCPRCASDTLHHDSVRVFDRGEDAPTIIETKVAGHLVTQAELDSAGAGNPSGRRDGLAIRFTCESCGGWPKFDPEDWIELTIAQHKGQTEIGWRYSPKKAR